MYDITNAKSFESVQCWYKEIMRYARSEVPILLIGNKTDVRHAREVSTIEGKALAEKLGMGFLETSAKTSIGVDEAFRFITSQVKVDMEVNRFDHIHPSRKVGPSIRICGDREASSTRQCCGM